MTIKNEEIRDDSQTRGHRGDAEEDQEDGEDLPTLDCGSNISKGELATIAP